MKVAALFYHKNALSLYKRRWIDRCVGSILNQPLDVTIYEMNYGGDCQFFMPDRDNVIHLVENLQNHVHCQNVLLDHIFSDGFDYIFNNNTDDVSCPTRFIRQLECMQEGQYDIVSSDFIYIRDQGNTDVFVEKLEMSQYNGRIKQDLAGGHNPVCHPGVCYSKHFWDNFPHYDVNAVPREDLLCWRGAAELGAKFYIVPEVLIQYRLHENQVTAKERK